MNELKYASKAAEELCLFLEKCIENDRLFSVAIQIEIDNLIRTSEMIRNNIREIRAYAGV